MKTIRLDKFLADMQVGTRSAVKQYIKKGLVTVNDEVAKKPEMKLDPAVDRVFFNDQEIIYETFVYYVLNKPAGVLSASRDKKQETVLDLLSPDDRRPDLFPVGRLDKDTTGLLLLTNNGAMSHNMLSPARHVDKTYLVRLALPVFPAAITAFSDGIDIGDEKPCLPAVLKLLPEPEEQDWMHASYETIMESASEQDSPEQAYSGQDSAEQILSEQSASERISSHFALVTIREGRYHQIKRMFEAISNEVTGLRRLSMGPLTLDSSLKEGEYRRITGVETNLLAPYIGTSE